MTENTQQPLDTDHDKHTGQTLDDIIRNADFPDDYDIFEDSQLDMIP